MAHNKGCSILFLSIDIFCHPQSRPRLGPASIESKLGQCLAHLGGGYTVGLGPLNNDERRDVSRIPLAIKAETVIRLRSRGESLSSRDQTSPKRTSSFNSANLGANLLMASLPAVTLSMIIPSFYRIYFNLVYSASSTGSSHSALEPGTEIAIWANQLSGAPHASALPRAEC